MYGTIARMKAKPDSIDTLKSRLSWGGEERKGFESLRIFQSDEDSTEFWAVAIFEDRESYVENADSPEQHQRYLELRALLSEDPEWHDGEVVHVSTS